MSLYTKYRPKDWDSVVGQNSVITILRASLEANSTNHAYLFTGSRGTGKTTSARIFAKSLNCENLQNGNPCHQCANCQAFDNDALVDIVEMDGASNRGIDEVRKFIETAKFQPTQWKYKVYIIDEVHMFTTEAFNAFLKLLEEPPAHVKFILATTEIHKVPETIQSRVLRFDFHNIPEEKIVQRLQFVCDQELISPEPKSLEVIAKMAHGGMRNALTLLEQYTINKTVSLQFLEESFSLVDADFLETIINILKEKKHEELDNIFRRLSEKHIDVQNFFDQMLFALRDKMFANLGKSDFSRYNEILEIFKKSYASIKIIPDGKLLLEITLLQAISNATPVVVNNIPPANIPKTIPQTPPATPTKTHTLLNEKSFKDELKKQVQESQKSSILPPENSWKTPNIPKENSEQKSEFNFRKLLTELKNKPVLLATLKNASFSQNNQELSLNFTKNWDYNIMNEPKHTTDLKSTLSEIFGGEWHINVTHKPHVDTSYVDEVF